MTSGSDFLISVIHRRIRRFFGIVSLRISETEYLLLISVSLYLWKSFLSIRLWRSTLFSSCKRKHSQLPDCLRTCRQCHRSCL